jgi:integrase/recombinase XerD
MTALRHRMIEALQLRAMSARPQEMSVRAVRPLAEHYHKSPDRLTEEELRQYFLYRKNVPHYSRSASTIALCGIPCFSEHTLKREGTPLTFVCAPQEKKLPVILSVEEGRTILALVQLLRSRVCLTTIYSCGLRLQKGTPLHVDAIDSARRLVPVRNGKGAKDRSVPLSLRTVELLRHSGATPRHPVWKFPAPGRSGIGMPTATVPMPRRSVQAAFHAAVQDSGLRTRASGHTVRHAGVTPVLAAGVTLRLMQEYLGYNSPTTPSISTHLPVTAEQLGAAAIHQIKY